MSTELHVESDNQLFFTIITMCYLRTDYLFQRHLCKNTTQLMQEEKIEKVSVPEVYLVPCSLSMIDLTVKSFKDFGCILFLREHFHRIRCLTA